MRARDKIKLTIIKLLKDNPADQLTIKTLLMEANVSKQSLYNNFYGILDAVCETVCDLFDEAAGEYFGQEDWMTGLKETLRMLNERRDVMMHLWNSKWRYDILNALSDHVYPIILNGLDECEERSGITVTDEDKRVVAGLYQDIVMGLLMRYMHERMEHNPEDLIAVYEAILEKDTAYGLKRISSLRKTQNAGKFTPLDNKHPQ
jgi:hypothetical protein